MKLKKRTAALVASVLVVSALVGYKFLVADRNKSALDNRWEDSAEDNKKIVEHAQWQTILDDYLVTDTDSGVNLFDYLGLIDDGREPLDQYVSDITSKNPLLFNRAEQKAYWINLYNAVTVALILDNYPLASITEIGGKLGSFGPWDNDVVVVNSIDLSLNDIEHRIIRPLYNDYRIHFAVNCASIGCPNLSAQAFTSSNMEQLLNESAAEYIGHARGVAFNGNKLQLSSLFQWYAIDFGANDAQILKTLSNHATSNTKNSLLQFNGNAEYFYDWSLNGYCSVDDECGS